MLLDLASRKVVGWAIADRMRASLVCEAFETALGLRRPPAGLILPFRAASPSAEFRRLLEANGITQSLSRPRQCRANSVLGSWFSTLKEELSYRHALPTVQRARAAIFDYVDPVGSGPAERGWLMLEAKTKPWIGGPPDVPDADAMELCSPPRTPISCSGPGQTPWWR